MILLYLLYDNCSVRCTTTYTTVSYVHSQICYGDCRPVVLPVKKLNQFEIDVAYDRTYIPRENPCCPRSIPYATATNDGRYFRVCFDDGDLREDAPPEDFAPPLEPCCRVECLFEVSSWNACYLVQPPASHKAAPEYCVVHTPHAFTGKAWVRWYTPRIFRPLAVLYSSSNTFGNGLMVYMSVKCRSNLR